MNIYYNWLPEELMFSVEFYRMGLNCNDDNIFFLVKVQSALCGERTEKTWLNIRTRRKELQVRKYNHIGTHDNAAVKMSIKYYNNNKNCNLEQRNMLFC